MKPKVFILILTVAIKWVYTGKFQLLKKIYIAFSKKFNLQNRLNIKKISTISLIRSYSTGLFHLFPGTGFPVSKTNSFLSKTAILTIKKQSFIQNLVKEHSLQTRQSKISGLVSLLEMNPLFKNQADCLLKGVII